MSIIVKSTEGYNDTLAHKLWEQAAPLFADKKPENFGWKYAVKPFLKNICSNANLGKVLDAGCGIGDLLDVADIDKNHYIGADWAGRLVEICKESYPEYQFVNKSIYFLPDQYPNEFDSVFSINVLQDCEFLQHSSKALFDCLKPGGRAFFIIENPYWTAYSIRSSNDSIKLPVNNFEVFFSNFLSVDHPIIGWHRPLNYYRKVFKQTGFKHVWSGIEVELDEQIHSDPVAKNAFKKNGAFNTDIFVYFELIKPIDSIENLTGSYDF